MHLSHPGLTNMEAASSGNAHRQLPLNVLCSSVIVTQNGMELQQPSRPATSAQQQFLAFQYGMWFVLTGCIFLVYADTAMQGCCKLLQVLLKSVLDVQDAMRLYSSAIDKLEKVLALQPNNAAALLTCGLALKDMALCMQPDDPDTQINLEVFSIPCAAMLHHNIWF